MGEKAITDTDKLETQKEELKKETTQLYYTINEERQKALLIKGLLTDLGVKIKELRAEGERVREEKHELQRELASIKESKAWRVIELLGKLKHTKNPLLIRQVVGVLLRRKVPPPLINSSISPRTIKAKELRCLDDLRISKETEGWKPVVRGGGRIGEEKVLSRDFRRRIVPVLSNQPYIFFFRNLDDSLSQVDLFLATYKRLNSCSLTFKVWSAGSPSGPLRTVEKNAILLLNNYYESFKFEPIGSAQGKDFIISLESPDSDFLNCVGIWEVKEKESYSKWCLQNEPTEGEEERIQKEIGELAYRPLISVIVPVYKSHLKWLRKAVASVLEQIYPNWELCVVDDGSNSEEIINYFHELSKRDDRIKYKILSENRGIS